jgi:hypothetical protein
MRITCRSFLLASTLFFLPGCIGFNTPALPQSGTTPAGTSPAASTELCAALNPASGNIVTVTSAQAAQLPSIVANAESGTIILLADGVYSLNQSNEASRLTFAHEGVTLRSASGTPENVVLDGGYLTNELVDIQASNVTIAEITLMHAKHYLLHVTPAPGATADIKAISVYRLRFIDAGEQFVEITSNGTNYADYSSVECSYFQLTDQGRSQVLSGSGAQCNTAGIDAHFARGWEVFQNYFLTFYCNSSNADYAIHFSDNSRDTIAEDNQIFSCSNGIGFGSGDGTMATATRTYSDNPYPNDGYIGHYDGFIRDNVVYSNLPSFTRGIGLAQARGAQIFQNTVVAGAGATAFVSALDANYANSIVSTANNLLSSTTTENSATLLGNHNLIPAPLSLFVNPTSMNFRLSPTAISALGQGTDLGGLAGLDPDGNVHAHGTPDIGAYETTY